MKTFFSRKLISSKKFFVRKIEEMILYCFKIWHIYKINLIVIVNRIYLVFVKKTLVVKYLFRDISRDNVNRNVNQ